ncbi:MAG: ribonucleoside triphosphate reductase [Lachnospiraceae bacterium]|uniref:ribonucleoside triphosphate reductase n=1 Tax=Simiaoa sp. TaxID=2944202 RepID=UPI001EB94739|nr:ribonucleoside triphosphate reductase [Lachnospiraceae bacterium]
MFQVIKRDGSKADFTLTKINDAIMKAFTATQMSYNNDIIDLLALRVTADFQKKVENDEIHVEDIQDSVERVLGQAGYEEVAKAYILYRKQREKMRAMKSTILDYKDVVNSYVKVEDWRVKENSTVTYSVGGLILSNSGAVTANYWLSEIYDEEIAEAHRNADIHIHDLSMLTGYCAGWSLKQLIKEGLGGITGKITSAPARHLSVLCNQMVNFLGIMQNEWAGAQAFSSFDTYLAPFVKVDHLSYPEVKKCIEAFIYGVNTPSRWGTQAPFSNITLDWTVPDDLAELPALVGGVEMDFKYKDCKKEMDMVNKAFIETMIEGDSNGRGFQYPIPTYSITKDFDWSDTENNRLLFEMTAKYGTPYFSNYINSDMQPSDVRSMCCRLRLDLRELRKKTGGFFGSGESTGSVGVVTINMPRIAYLSANKDEFYARLNHMMDIAARSLKIKRGVITKLLNEGLYPYTKRYLGTFENHFSTIGLIGMNEVGLNANWLRADMSDPRTQEFTKEVLNHMRERLSDYQEQYGDLYNLEATPAESTTYRLAKHDRKRWPGIKTAGKPGDTPYYTNSSHLPVDYTVDIFDALDIQDELQTLYTSGTVFHAFLGEKLPDWKAAASLVRTIASNYKLPYYTLSPTYSICKEHGYLAGEVKVCPHCGAKTEVYSRITGYYRPVQNWNDGKLQEYANRTEYDIVHSSLKRPTRSVVTLSNFAEDVEVKVEQPQDIKYLFTTKTCPNCKLVKEYLKNVSYVTIDAEENMELARRYGVMQAPTLVVVNGDSHKKYVNASNIKKYVDQLTLVGVE